MRLGFYGNYTKQTAEFAQRTHVRADAGQCLFRQPGRVCLVYDVLQVLLCQCGKFLVADVGRYPSPPACGDVATVSCARGLLLCGVPHRIGLGDAQGCV